MKLIIAGSRNFNISKEFIMSSLIYHFSKKTRTIAEIVSGGAKGVDFAAKSLCESKFGTSMLEHHFLGRYKEFEADWTKHGKSAGPIRNRQMAEYGDALLLIWDGESRGSNNMKSEMKKLGKPVYEVILKMSEEHSDI